MNAVLYQEGFRPRIQFFRDGPDPDIGVQRTVVSSNIGHTLLERRGLP